MQNHYNLIYCEEEREMLPLCQDQGVGVIPWSLRARLLTRPDTETARSETDEFGPLPRRDRTVVEGARRRRTPRCRPCPGRASRLLAQPAVTSPIVGVTRPEHLTDAIAAVDLELTDDEVAELGADYVAHAIAGHR
jgi:aryl-alcohol dehydrogenase (NADP+)